MYSTYSSAIKQCNEQMLLCNKLRRQTYTAHDYWFVKHHLLFEMAFLTPTFLVLVTEITGRHHHDRGIPITQNDHQHFMK